MQGTGRFPSVGGGDQVPETLGSWTGEMRKEDYSAHSRSPNWFSFSFFFPPPSSSPPPPPPFLRLAHSMNRCKLCTGMFCRPVCPLPWLPQPGKAREPWRRGDPVSGWTGFMLMNDHWGEDLPRGGGSGVTCQFLGVEDPSTRLNSSASYPVRSRGKSWEAGRKRVGKVGY